jgi:hypothetical protein
MYRSSLLILLIACGDSASSTPDAGPLGDAGPTDEPSPGVGLAVINSDFTSTSIALLDQDGRVTHGDCINSGTRPPGNTLALSGDVVLPSQAQPDHLVVAIDRTNAALTWIDPATCAPLRQLDVSTGFFANPHDVIAVSATKAYVTRYERNANPTANPDDHDDGEDLLIIDPSVPKVTGRIALARYATGADVQARPDRVWLAEGKVFVVLNNISASFGAIGPGRVVVIDPASDAVTAMIDLPGGLKNCGGLSYVPATRTLVVACGGDFTAADQAASSGVAYLDVANATVSRAVGTAPFGGRPIAGYSGSAYRGALGFGVTFGEPMKGTPKDQLWLLDVAAGTASPLLEAKASFTYGGVAVDPAHQRVYLTDGDPAKPRLQVFGYANPASPTQGDPIDASPTGLPTREITWY